MKRGEVGQELRTTQPEQSTEVLIEEMLAQIAAELMVPLGKLYDLGVTIERLELNSHINPNAISDNRQVNIWINDCRVGVIFEDRNERNNVMTKYVYFGVPLLES